MPSKEALKTRLRETRAELNALLNALTEAQWEQPIIEGNNYVWTVADILAHLAENERGMSIHVHKIRNGRETVPANFDLDEWNAGLKKRAGNPGSQEVQQQLEETRAKTLEVLDSISEEEWELVGRHPRRGEITIAQYYETMAEHEHEHMQDIKRALEV